MLDGNQESSLRCRYSSTSPSSDICLDSMHCPPYSLSRVSQEQKCMSFKYQLLDHAIETASAIMVLRMEVLSGSSVDSPCCLLKPSDIAVKATAQVW